MKRHEASSLTIKNGYLAANTEEIRDFPTYLFFFSAFRQRLRKGALPLLPAGATPRRHFPDAGSTVPFARFAVRIEPNYV
jgi:hypothetical protein